MNGAGKTSEADRRAGQIQRRVQSHIDQYGGRSPEDYRASSDRARRVKVGFYAGAFASHGATIGCVAAIVAERDATWLDGALVALGMGIVSVTGCIVSRMKSDQLKESAQVLEAAQAAQQLNTVEPMDFEFAQDLLSKIPEPLRAGYLINPTLPQILPPSAE